MDTSPQFRYVKNDLILNYLFNCNNLMKVYYFHTNNDYLYKMLFCIHLFEQRHLRRV